ncbi:MAG TPA: sugar phosphate isomerase/epimerase family protein [Gaiellaceae bacterium]|nr:sugar phosphate isomerase/epimerase family protein [Gaiellaceae bacterium]
MAPTVSVSQITTLASSFADDVATYAAAGADAIGVWELKLPEGSDAAALETLEASGLGRASAVPAVPSILPLPLLGGPEDPAERVEALCASLARLAPFRPSGVVCLTGAREGRDPDEAREVVVEGLRTIAAEAESHGLRIALEPYQRAGGERWSIAFDVPEALSLIHDAGERPALALQFDTWHLWNTPTLFDDIEQHVDRFAGVHVADYRDPTRSWADRVLPGDGVAGIAQIVHALEDAGWSGPYDIEVFSDDGTFGAAHDDSLWAREPVEVVREALEKFDRCLRAGALD